MNKCSKCEQSFSQEARDKHLLDFSRYHHSNLCLDCIQAALMTKQNGIYNTLKATIEEHERIKKAYHASAAKLSEVNRKFKDADYERNLIMHSIHMEKMRASKPAKTKKSTEQVSEDLIKQMLANLPDDARAAVLAKFNAN